MSPRRYAKRLISSEIPCRVSRKNPTGTSSRAGQRTRPPALPEISPLVQAFMKTGHDDHIM